MMKQCYKLFCTRGSWLFSFDCKGRFGFFEIKIRKSTVENFGRERTQYFCKHPLPISLFNSPHSNCPSNKWQKLPPSHDIIIDTPTTVFNNILSSDITFLRQKRLIISTNGILQWNFLSY